ncbi:conserved hypothetical protein [Perkinsus marinus ATCC 50983]|uniref:Glycosyl hydrolase family 92 domain-containing protein n=1 Tax=Perkinsus marinus (strain ATCC 50983 / TXsc) TaxID=423536 RepID=C5LCV7_PERM5|nr:conserved hypothetical protein [Perkinsus marinus ATCC 50983]EER05410.1 conserved hypothetical protein [Perkinsus marinus ATCC 50983]|eukprot:XP_002773594.1 conserved hypothetical protein [Perkinsus marinus ATCC 50983]
MLFPRLLGEYDQNNQLGHYSVYTGKVVPGELATDSGFWDAYRTVYLWLSVAAPDILDRLLEGWVNAYKEAGWLPTWASPGQRGSMVGTMGDVVFGWAIIANKTPHLADDMYAAIRKDAFVERPKNSQFGREGLSAYSDRGYIPVKSNVSEVVSRGLNFAEADSVIAAAASKLGHYSDASVLYGRAQNALEKSFNTESKLFEPLEASGNWISPFDPSLWSDEFFTEASARQYRFYAPFNVDFLITKYSGREALCEHLENHFSEQVCPVYTSGNFGLLHEETELGLTSEDFGQYGHNNQPSHHVLGIAVAAQCFHVADKYMEKVLTELYTPDGWSGDEDNGEMAAWYMLNSLGFYMIDFAKDELLLFAPLVKGNYTISLLGEKTAVRVENVDLSGGHASSRPYVCEVHWYPLRGNINAAELELDSARSVRGLTRRPEPVDYVVLETRRLARTDFVKGGRLVYFTSASRC